MAILKNGLFSGFSGRLGDVVVYELNGQTVVRSMPRKKYKKATGKRKQYQDDFRYLMQWMQLIKPMLDICWEKEEVNKKAFQTAFSFHLKKYRNLNRPIHFDWIQFSKSEEDGILPNGQKLEKDSYKISWNPKLINQQSHPLDTVHICLINYCLKESIGQIISKKREVGECILKHGSWKKEDKIIAFVITEFFTKPKTFSKTYHCVF